MSLPFAEPLGVRTHAATRVTAHAHRVSLAAILGLAAYLNFWALDRNGWANTYYAAAVRSMMRSWHNFFFASFDPGGLVSVDKPPLALWVETASAKIFGYSGVAILAPEALAGVGAVALVYLLVVRHFGRVAALLAALALAVSPVSVAVSRDNNPDALFVLLLVLAAYCGVRAVESGRLRWLLGTAVVVGLAFNTKMLASLVVLPGLALAYLFFAPVARRVRLWHLLIAGLVLFAVSAVWIAAVDLTPAVDRPYVGSTSDNSALSLALDYNGLGRVLGQSGGTSTGGGLGGAFSGTPGVFRLLNDALGDQGGWLLPLAVIGGVSACVAAVRARRRLQLGALTIVGVWFAAAAAVFSLSSGIIHTYYISALAPASCALVGIGAVALWRDARRSGLWALFPLSAIVLTAWLELVLLRRSGYLPWIQTIVITGAVLAVAGIATQFLRGHLTDRVAALVAAGAIASAVAAFLVAPAAWSQSTLTAAVDGVFPGAGPNFVSGLGVSSSGVAGGVGGFVRPSGGAGRGGFAPPAQGGGGFGPPTGAPPTGGTQAGVPGGVRGGAFGGGDTADVTAALAYAKAHGGSKRFTLIVSSEQTAASSVIAGEPVAAMGGFTGRETVLTSSYLARLVRSGEARYFLLGSGGGMGGGFGASNAAVQTITSTCRLVSSSAWSSTSTSTSGSSLYDCRGRAAAIAATG